MQQWEADGHLPLRPCRALATRCSPSTRRRPPSAARCTSATCSATPTPTPSPASSACAGKAVFYPIGWDDNGLATERRVQNFTGVRCDPSLPFDPDVPRAVPRRRARRTTAPSRSAGPTSSSSAARSPTSTSRRSRSCSAASACRSTGRCSTPPSATALAVSASARSCATWPAARRTSRTRPRCTTSTSAPRSPRPRWKIARSPARYHQLAFHRTATEQRRRRRPAHRHHPPRAARQLRRHGRPSRRPALPAAVRHHRAHAAVRRRGAHPRPPPRRPREGHRHRDDLHVRRHHRRHLVARAEPAVARAHRLRRPLRHRDARVDHHRRRASRPTQQIAGLAPKQAQKQIVELLQASRARCSASRAPSRIPVKFYERGSRPLEIVATRQWYIRNGGRDDAAARRAGGPRQRAHVAPAVHAAPLRQLGRRPERRLADQPPAVLRRADPAVVPARRRRQPRLRPGARAQRRPAAGRPVDRLPRRLHQRPARRARRLHRRPRRHGHVGHVVAHTADRRRHGKRTDDACSIGSSRWTCARRATTSSARGCSPRWCAATTSTAARRGATLRCRAGSSIPTARRCRRARATSSPRCTCSSSTAPTPSATGRRAAGPVSTPRSTRAR